MTEPMLNLESRENGVSVIWMDDPEHPVNTLRKELIDEFQVILDAVEKDSEIRILVFASGKPDSFIAGANLEMLLEVHEAADARSLSEISQRIQHRIASLRPTTVAAIHGPCLGGGLELALAFDARVASDDKKTRLGLPEVQLGLLPGGGGTQRLPRLIGVERALDMLLTGRNLSPKRALKAGLVNDVVHPAILIDAAIARGRKLFEGHRPSSTWSEFRTSPLQGAREWLLTGNPVGREFVFKQAHKRAEAKARGNYPAPARILEAVRTGLESGVEAGESAEARAFGDLVVTPEAKELIGLFFAGNELKKESGVPHRGIEPLPVEKVGVLGAGLMGAGISYVSIDKAGVPVRLKDIKDQNLSHGLAHVHKILEERVNRRSITPLQRAQTFSRLTPTLDYSGFSNCDLVIEAVFEDLELKQKILKEFENHCDEQCIFATNTSALPVAHIAEAGARPENVIGMHYFSPVEKMPLLEIVVTEKTEPWVTATCVAFGRQQSKTVIVVHDGPGFYTSRILGPFVNEAARMLTEGVPIGDIDEALLAFGFPIGPMALLDEVGIDVGHKVAHTLHRAFGDRMQPTEGMDKLIEDKRLGKKNKRGLYIYSSRKTKSRQADESVYELLGVTPSTALSHQQIAERCALQMVNEAAYCLGERIIQSPRDGDIGAVFGLGFPPFLGGPFRYLDRQGTGPVVDRLNRLCDQYGERFQPAPLLVEQMKNKGMFYDGHDNN